MVDWLTEGDYAGAYSTDSPKSVKLFVLIAIKLR
jgi:hypothetical protein